MLKNLINEELKLEKVTFTWESIEGETLSKTILLREVDLFTVKYQPTKGKGKFIVKEGKVYIQWEDFHELTDLLNPRNDSLTETELIPKDLETFNKLVGELDKIKFDLCSTDPDIVKALEKIYKQIDKIKGAAAVEKSDSKSVTEIAKLIEKNKFAGNTEAESMSISGNTITFWYMDPPVSFEQAEYSEHEEEQEITNEGLKKIEDFLRSLSDQIVSLEVEDYHLAEVKFSVKVKV